MESMCLIFFTSASQGSGFFQLWGVSHSVRQIRPPSFDGTLSHLPGFVKASSFHSIQVHSIVCCLSAHAFHLPGLCFESCWRWTGGTESKLRQGLGPLVSRFLGGGLTLKMSRRVRWYNSISILLSHHSNYMELGQKSSKLVFKYVLYLIDERPYSHCITLHSHNFHITLVKDNWGPYPKRSGIILLL